MKLIYYAPNGHHKNIIGIQLMCKARSIDFEYADTPHRLQTADYDILIASTVYVEPSTVPPNVKIILGPQLWVFPSGPVIGPYNASYEGRVSYNSLSEWVKNYVLEMAPSFVYPIAQLPYAVDVDTFKPMNKQPEFDCLVYQKHRLQSVVDNVIHILNEKALTYRIVKYGHYSESDYLQLLQQCKFMVCVDAHESQGFALQEAMSCDIPLLVLNATSMYDETNDGVHLHNEYLRPKKLTATSAPYWSDECGIKVTDIADFPNALETMLKTYETFQPRNYILKTLSPAACMDRILDYFGLSV